MDALLTAIVTWLAINFGLPASYEHPAIELLPATEIAELRYGASEARSRRDVVAVYHDTKATIYLADGWTGKAPAELSVLVHEMVHHLQKVGGLKYECPAAREELAYAAQDTWLGLFDRTLLDEFDIDRATLKLTTSCLRH